MSDKVLANFYNTVDLESYRNDMVKVSNDELILEFEVMINLFQIGHADQAKVGKLYHLVKKELRSRMYKAYDEWSV